MANSPPPDYYHILEVTEDATTQQIRNAYKRAALKVHPDRVAADSPDRASRTRKFQLVNDAYYTLSDPTRRREYDAQRRLFGGSRARPSKSANSNPNPPGSFTADYDDPEEEEIPLGGDAGAGFDPSRFYSWAWDFFMKNHNTPGARQATEDAQFQDAFEEMYREEGMEGAEQQGAPGRFWSLTGGAAGAVLGFIVANVPGAMAGAVGGHSLGRIRDTHKKSVYAAFQDLPQGDKARLLAQLATRVLSHAAGV
ncbi:DnaJ-domain-containing protein [Xylariaceae sp. FL0255]|nr:DnaJ-domain-containing protein [Xylariaceae sp. FL0255]